MAAVHEVGIGVAVRRLGRPPEAERPDRLREITEAAIDKFAEQGYAASTFASVAGAAGITPAALYRYFDDKCALYLHAVRSSRDEVWRDISERLDDTGTLVGDFQSLLDQMNDLHEGQSARRRLLASVQVEARHHAELAQLLAERWQVRDTYVGDIARRAFERGELTRFHDAEQAAMAIELVFSGLVTEMGAYPGHSRELSVAALGLITTLVSEPSRPR